jgi:CelD/BcsL family acetyltransferase involved in cellulose biosynthesis
MKVTTIPADDLSEELVAAWKHLQTADRSVDSPFFRPEFTQAVAAVRHSVEVAVLEHEGQYVGFFPYQRSRGDVGRPVGGRLSDFQGIVMRPGIQLDPMQLVRHCRLSVWHFDHLIAAHTAFVPFHWSQACSPCIDLSSGYEAYIEQRRAAGATDVLQVLKKRRKSEHQMGTVRFEPRTTDTHVLDTLIKWKSQQYHRSGSTSPFSFPCTVALLERLLTLPDTSDFAGMLSALYIGDRLAAAHFGMRSGRVLHWWFPAYDPELSKYSPGSQLLLELAKVGGSLGIDRIDLGKGVEPYKCSFMTGAIPLAEGSVDARAVTRTMQRAWHHARHWTRQSPLRAPALRLRNWMLSTFNLLGYTT